MLQPVYSLGEPGYFCSEVIAGQRAPWIDFAIANRVEKLHLEFGVFLPHDQQYKLSEECWYGAPSGLF